MALVDDVKATVGAVKASIDNAISVIGTLRSGAGTVPDADVQAALNDLNTAKTSLDTATAPPAPPPPT